MVHGVYAHCFISNGIDQCFFFFLVQPVAARTSLAGSVFDFTTTATATNRKQWTPLTIFISSFHSSRQTQISFANVRNDFTKPNLMVHGMMYGRMANRPAIE